MGTWGLSMAPLQGISSSNTSVHRPRLGLFFFFLIAFMVPWTGWFVFNSSSTHSRAFESVAMFWLPAAVSLAGFVASFVEGGAAGLLAFVRRVFNVRFEPWFWLVAVLLPLIAGMLTFLWHPHSLSAGGHPAWSGLLVPLTFANLWTGPLAEEFGWRGYLLQRFPKRLSPWVAGLVIGLIWSCWHIPLFYNSVFAHAGSALQFVATTTAWSVVMALVVTRCFGSVLPSVVLHFFINSQAPLIAALFPLLPAELVPGGWAFCLASVAVALIVALGWRLFSKESLKDPSATAVHVDQSV
jgi:uncharacterized protein